MGKAIEEKYSDVSHRIIKKSSKKEKLAKSTSDVQPSKRKLPSIEDDEQPKPKQIKLENVNFQAKPEVEKLQVTIPKQDEIICSEIFAVQSGDGVRLDIKENKNRDLFLHDELSDSYENYTNNDLSFQIVDEISLEGLDGITIEAFWKRLSQGLERSTYISDYIKEAIWKFICAKKDIQFFKLQEPRGVLDIYDRSKYLDMELGVIMELAYELPEIYPYEPINNPDVQGSCSTFTTRTDVSTEVKDLDLKNADQQYGNSLVMVADQKLRTKALFCEASDPTAELINIQYCILERIGRSRKQGELTQGNMSIGSHFKMDPKSIYHYKKQLIQYNLLAKQFFYIKSAVVDQNKTGKLLNLKRFYQKIKPKQMVIVEQIVNIMKERPDCRIECTELRKMFQFSRAVNKTIKSAEFRKYVKTEMMCYRDLYPKAKESEYMRKSNPIEKFITCYVLIDPYANVSATWYREQDDSDDDNEEDEETGGGQIITMEIFKEVYYHIRSKGREGCTLQDVQKIMGVDNNTIRMALKKLLGTNTVSVKKFDQGKQRHLVYYAQGVKSEDVNSSGDQILPPANNNILEKLKQRQAAVKKIKQTAIRREEIPSVKREIKWKHHIPFFIKNIEQIICDTEEPNLNRKFTSIERNSMIKLCTKFLRTEQLFDINKTLNSITPEIVTRTIKVNFNTTYISKNEVDYITKVILLKAAFGDVVINADTLNCFSRKRQLATVPILFDTDKEKVKMGSDKLEYMGSAPVTVFNEKEDNIAMEIVVSTPPAEFKDQVEYPASRQLSERIISRIRIILKTVYEKRIFEEMYKLVKVIEEEELRQGYTSKIDRKSLARILKRLVGEGYIKVYKLKIYDDKITKTQTFICHPSVDYTNSLIQSASEQLKWKYFVGIHKKSVKSNAPEIIQKSLEQKIQSSPFTQSDVMKSVLELKELNKQPRECGYKLSRQWGKRYGFKPKFIRMRIVHEFLYYLIYNYEKDTKPLSEDECKTLFESYHINVSKDDLKRIPTVYRKEISWKMFVPPLPHHAGWDVGWALMCDVILRFPISVLCKVHNVSFEVPELYEILNHPVKRFFLVKDLPENVRLAVLYKRKALFDIHETICRLAWCGLAQFGPQKYKEKDQVFIYFNRRASLLDTTTSEPAYNKVTDKEYKMLPFFFNSQNDVDNFWYNAYGICLSTKLNTKQVGERITIFNPQSKPQLAQAMKSKTAQEAIRDDNGEIPGDRKGAAGFDSSLWSHIIKNWFWSNQRASAQADSKPKMGLRKEKLEKVLPKNVSYKELHGPAHTKVYLHKKARKESKANLRKYVHVPLKPSKTLQKITRKICARPKSKHKRQYYDQIDKTILKMIGPMARMQWSEEEDRMLLLCMAASIFLNPRCPKKQSVPYATIRDVLHRVRPESKNKTSRACQRRMKKYLYLKHRYVEDNISNLFKLEPISNYYSTLVTNILQGTTDDKTKIKYSDPQLSAAFVILMSYLVKHQDDVEILLQGNSTNIEHLAEDRLYFTEKNLVLLDEKPQKYADAENENDIKKDVLKSVIHSSLGCRNRSGGTFQLFKIYQKYPDSLICETLGELSQSQMISFQKIATKKSRNRWHSPYQLSKIYVYAQSTTFSITTCIEAYKTFLSLKENRKFLDFSQETIDLKKYGQLLSINEFCSFWNAVEFEFYLPRTMVILNPQVKDHTELTDELAVRWQARLKKMFQDNTDADIEQENESENRSKSHDFEAPSSSKEDSTSEVDNYRNLKNVPTHNDNHQNNPLDLTVEAGDSETIDRLKTWVTDCMEAERETRSPSPEFMNLEEEEADTGKVASQESSEGHDEVDKINIYTVRKMVTKDNIPTLEEIKEGMLKYTPPNEDRIIPYITDLCSLLNRDFTDATLDEEKLERLKSHFITQYAVLEDIKVGEIEDLKSHFMVQYIESTSRNRNMWEKIRRKLVINKPEGMSEVYRLLREGGGRQSDFDLADRIVSFVLDKKCFGATGPQIKEHFEHSRNSCPLEQILQVLVDTGIFLRTGICTVTFVHHVHQQAWLVETFSLSNEEQMSLEEKANTQSNVKENLEKQLEEKILIHIPVMPWVKVDGTLNEDTLKLWLCNILSHCLDNPKITFMKLCEKFCYLKPVDIYYLVEVLQELGCVELCAYEENMQDIFSCWEFVDERAATCLDRFENMYITPNSVSMTCMGSFFYEGFII